jgi:hypothetical protein
MNSILLNKHLLHRAGFGVDLKDISRIKQFSPRNLERIIKKSENIRPLKSIWKTFLQNRKKANAEMKKFFPKRRIKEENAETQLNWYQNMISDEDN